MTAAKIVAIYIGLALSWYLTGAFLAASFNLAQWATPGRFLAVAVWLITASCLVAHLRQEGDL